MAITRAKQFCEISGFQCLNHFVEVNKMVALGSGSQREIIDYKRTRYDGLLP